MTELEHSNALVIPTTGVLVNLDSEKEVAIAYRDLREIKTEVDRVERTLREALQARKEILGTGTFYIEGVGKVEVKGDKTTEWDIVALQTGLRDAGMPEESISEIVVRKESFVVDARRAERAAKANPEYARVIEAAKFQRPKLPSVNIT